MDEIPSLGYWVRRRRKALDLTQTDLARLVFCSLSTIKKIELDERRPSRLMAERLTDCLQVHGRDREAFLAIASAELTFDRFNPTIDQVIPKPVQSNLSSYQSPTPFIGYQDELAKISSLIHKQGTHLITLVGLGGIGKTRLSLQIAQEQLDNFSAGVFFIPLAQLDSPAYIPSAILNVLSLPRPNILNLKAYLLEYLQDKAMLLVLDDFEHLLDGADLLADIAHMAPSVVLLTTSRIPLNLSIEHVFDLKGMPIPSTEGIENPEAYDAVQLFVQTARRVGSEEELTKDNLSNIIRICKLVDGLPLAIELAASWARTRSFAEIAAGIQGSLDYLTSEMRDITGRHKSIYATFEYSWQFLSEEEKRVFSALSIFRGGFHIRAVQTIAGVDRVTLESLVSKSLLRRSAGNRYDMHELLRRYSELKLNDPEKSKQYRDRHLAYYLHLAENTFEANTSQNAARAPWIENEIDNFRAALTMTIEDHAQERGLRLVTALGPFWYDNGYLLEGMSWLSKILKLDDGRFPSLRAKALVQAAKLAQDMGDFEQAIIFSKESLSLFKEVKDQIGIGLSLMSIGITHYLNGEFERGIKLLNKSLSIFQDTGAEKYQAQALIRVADVNMRRGILDKASDQWQQALLISSKLNLRHEMAFSMGGLGDIKRLQGKYQEAFELYRNSLKIHWEENQRLDIPYVIEALAMDYVALGLMDQAVVLWGAAEKMREEIRSPLPPSYRRSYAPAIEEARSQLGETKFFEDWQTGRSAPLEEIVTKSINLPGVEVASR